MCGIAGIIGINPNQISIHTLVDKIAHRGPDAMGFWKSGNIQFGHSRLRIIDLSDTANQPMMDFSTGNVIIFNGEIYNYRELRKQLEDEYIFNSNSDTEVILAAYKQFGVGMFSRLRGMFAFALYDAHLEKVIIARDRMGIKPLFYRKIKNTFIFGSEVKVVTNNCGIQDKLNEIKAYEFLANARLDADEFTLFEEVMQLPAAHYLWVDKRGHSEDPISYWKFPELGTRKFDTDSKEEFIHVMDEVINLHIRSDVPVGAFLSGGLDSSAIVGFMLRQFGQSKFDVFSAILPYYHPENSLIQEFKTHQKNIQYNELDLNGDDFFDIIPRVIEQNGAPILDGSVYSHYKLCELAKEKNVKVLLSGSGGDELFGGYESMVHAQHSRLLYQWRFGKYLKDLIRFRRERESNTYSHLFLRSTYECLPNPIRNSAKNVQLFLKFRHLEIHPKVSHYYYRHRDPYMANMLNNYRSWTAPPFLHYEDRNSMRFGIEIRVPFFDHKLIEFILSFNSDEIISGNSKSLLRKSFRGIVPDKILNQKGKFGFPSPLDHILRSNPAGKEIFFDHIKKTPLLDRKKTEKLAQAFYQGDKSDLSVFWRTLSFMIWYQLHFENRGI